MSGLKIIIHSYKNVPAFNKPFFLCCEMLSFNIFQRYKSKVVLKNYPSPSAKEKFYLHVPQYCYTPTNKRYRHRDWRVHQRN
jgi:hypothetical protein